MRSFQPLVGLELAQRWQWGTGERIDAGACYEQGCGYEQRREGGEERRLGEKAAER